MGIANSSKNKAYQIESDDEIDEDIRELAFDDEDELDEEDEVEEEDEIKEGDVDEEVDEEVEEEEEEDDDDEDQSEETETDKKYSNLTSRNSDNPKFKGASVKIENQKNNKFIIRLLFSNKRNLSKTLQLKRKYKKREPKNTIDESKIKKSFKKDDIENEDEEDEDIEDELMNDDDEGIGIDDVDEDELDEDELLGLNTEDESDIDLSKLSGRQRAKYLGTSEEPDDLKPEFYQGKKLPRSVLALIEGNSKKKQLTAEEMQLRKAEAARKRKTFNMRKLEAEKKETLKKLLHRKVEKVDAKKQEEELERRKQNMLKRKEIIKHKAIFSWISKTEIVNGEKTSTSYYSMQ
jgi:Ino eighty subunit 2